MTKLIKIPVNIEKEYGRTQLYAVYNPDGTIKEWVNRREIGKSPNEKYFALKSEYSSLVAKYKESQQEEFVGGMPVQMEKECMGQLLRTDQYGHFVYRITLKVDGERYLLFLSKDGNVYFIDRALMFYYLENDNAPFFNIRANESFLLDGELVKNGSEYEFLVFDILFLNSASVIEKDYSERYYLAGELIKKEFAKYPMVSLKTWFFMDEILSTNNIYDHVLKRTNAGRSNKLKADGLILQPFDTPYVTFGPWNKYNNVLFKWKPAKDLTLDFKIKIINDKEWQLLTKSGMNYDVKGETEMIHAISVPSDEDIIKYKDGDVAEFKYISSGVLNKYGNKFKIVRPRFEKEANSLASIMSTMNVIKNSFDLDILKPALTPKHTNLQIYSKNTLMLCILKNYLFFTKPEISIIKSIYEKYLNTPNAELEFRLLKNGKNLDKFTFYYLSDFFMKNFKSTRTVTTDIVSAKINNKVYRSTYSESTLLNNEYKLKLKDFTLKNTSDSFNKLGLKLNLSQEVPVDQVTKAGTVRLKDRVSYLYPLWRIDVTKVLTDSQYESFEIECEFTGNNLSFDEFIKSFSNIYIIILQNSSYC